MNWRRLVATVNSDIRGGHLWHPFVTSLAPVFRVLMSVVEWHLTFWSMDIVLHFYCWSGSHFPFSRTTLVLILSSWLLLLDWMATFHGISDLYFDGNESIIVTSPHLCCSVELVAPEVTSLPFQHRFGASLKSFGVFASEVSTGWK